MTDQPNTNQQDSKAPAKGQAEKKIPDRSYTPPETLSEAGGSISGKIYAISQDGRVIADLQATARGATLRDALDNFIDGLNYGKAKYRLTLEEPPAPLAPAPIPPLQALYGGNTAPTSPAPNNQGQSAPPPPQNATQGLTTPPNGGTIHATKLEIEIRQDGRANLQFFEAGHKWADLSTVRSIEDACGLLAPIGGFTAAHLTNGATYTINALIAWTPGKTNSKGKPYKDIAEIRPA